MFRLVRRLAILSAISVAFSSAPFSAQSQPGSPAQSTPQNPAPLPSQAAPPQSPATPQPAQQPGTLPEQPAPPASATPPQTPSDQPLPPSPRPHPLNQPRGSSLLHHLQTIPKAAKKDNDKPINQADVHNASLWRDPGNISAKDLFYGDGGKDGQPARTLQVHLRRHQRHEPQVRRTKTPTAKSGA